MELQAIMTPICCHFLSYCPPEPGVNMVANMQVAASKILMQVVYVGHIGVAWFEVDMPDVLRAKQAALVSLGAEVPQQGLPDNADQGRTTAAALSASPGFQQARCDASHPQACPVFENSRGSAMNGCLVVQLY